MTKRILFSAGEISGDEHLSEVLKELKKLIPNSEFAGLAGPSCRNQGFPTDLKIEDYASVMGFSAVVKALPKILSALNWFKHQIKAWKPDLLILVDYPDFNLRLAKIAKAQGIKVLYFIPPKIWAWRSSRIEALKKYTDSIALIFPFESSFYRNLDCSQAIYVGHPFYSRYTREANDQKETLLRTQFLKSINVDPTKKVLAFFPGSRNSEIDRHWRPMTEALKALIAKQPDLQILLSVSLNLEKKLVKLTDKLPFKITVLRNANLEILRFSDAGFLKSGTTNLQAAFYELPFVMFYRASKITKWIVDNFISIKEYSLVNIIRSGSIEELIDPNETSEMIASKIFTLLSDDKKKELTKKALKDVHSALGTFDQLSVFSGSCNAYQRVALLANELIVE